MMAMNMNVEIFQWIHGSAGTRPGMDSFAILFAEGGPWILAVFFVGLWFFVEKNKKNILMEATQAAIIGLIFNQLIGFFYFHPRPYMVGLCTPLFPHGPETSFPSDHATLMFAAAIYLLMARRWTAFGIPLLVVTALTAWGRVYSGIHFPFDMAGSLGVGLVSAWMMHLFAGRILPVNEKLIRFIDNMLKIFIKREQKE